ncbi:methylcytosine dioxygenase TET2 isoform X2 [Erpetoichthys calabaricus]|uniref:Methylcytosine dioxygenase TET n=1 Tax=Erpetoichthys calabaricus TaxID=27687 RepID=A0A8C4SJ35_ERPCA|nr:methylcytosine dioxygenase TET2 isoform X2 [Erpetoichthys calabaricus]
MEQEQANHVADNRLSPLLVGNPSKVHQTEKFSPKLQNGNQSPETLQQLHRINGEYKWLQYKSNQDTGQMKRHQESCLSPMGMQNQLENPQCLENGGNKRFSSDSSLLGYHQSKKLKVDFDLKIEENKMTEMWSETKVAETEPKQNTLPDLTKFLDCHCDGLECPDHLQNHQNDHTLEKQFHCYNGNVFSRNNQVPETNGATVFSSSSCSSSSTTTSYTYSSSIKDVHDDLLEKTLSQYFPQHVSTELQKCISQEHLGKSPADLQCEAKNSTCTSQMDILPQTSVSTQPQVPETVSLDVQSPRVCNAPIGNSSMNAFQVVSQLSQGQKSYTAQSTPLHKQNVGNAEAQIPQNILSPGAEGNVKIQTECLNNDHLTKPNMLLDKGTFPGLNSSNPCSQDETTFTSCEDGTEKPMEEIMQMDESTAASSSSDVQHRLPEHKTREDQNAPKRRAELESSVPPPLQNHLPLPQLSIKEPETLEFGQHEHGDKALQGLMTSQKQGRELENEIICKEETDGILQQPHSYSQIEWITLNSSQPQSHESLHPVWENVNSELHHPKQAHSQDQSHLQNPKVEEAFHMQAFSPVGIQQQDKAIQQASLTDAAKWHKENVNHSLSTLLESQTQLSTCQQYFHPQPQKQNSFQPQQEHLSEEVQDIQHLLPSQFLHEQPHNQNIQQPQQYFSQDAKDKKASQVQHLAHQQYDYQLLEAYNKLKFSSKEPHHNLLANVPDTNLPANQYQQAGLPMSKQACQKNLMQSYGNINGAIKEEHCQFSKIQDGQQSRYSPHPGTSKQYAESQQMQRCNIQPRKMAGHSPPSQETLKSTPGQSTLSYHASKEHVISEVYPKSELRESCAKFSQGQLQSSARHAALRWHLLQRQEQAFQQNSEDFQRILQSIKVEQSPQCDRSVTSQDRVLGNSSMKNKIKQEFPQSHCTQQIQQKSIIATMEQQLKQYHVSPLFDKKPMTTKSPKQVKIENCGPITILSTNTNLATEDVRASTQKRASSEITPTKKSSHNLNVFLESPLKLLDTPIKNLLDTPIKTQYEFPSCHCVEQISEKDEGPYYTHLGAGPNVAAIRKIIENRYGESGKAIRIEKAVYTGKEGKSAQGCPIAKWVIRRTNKEEKILILVRERAGHSCETAVLVILILIWEGISNTLADSLYVELSDTLRKHGALTNRRCALNEERTCACQGLDPETCGASFSFGCSWSMYYNGCKFARSKLPRKFRLLGDDPKEEEKLESSLQNLATVMAPIYGKMAPDAYSNQVEHEQRAADCRLGLKEGRPFSGVTACLDFCAHAHRDLHNMQSGSTLVCTLTKEDNRDIGKIAEDEQLHVLPLYKISATDEFGNAEAQQEKIKSGAIQVLTSFRRPVRMLAEPAKTCRQRKQDARRAAAAAKLSHSDTPNSKSEKNNNTKVKEGTYDNVQSTGSHAAQLSAGNMRANFQSPGLSNQQSKNLIPGSPHLSNYPRFPSTSSSYSNTSESLASYPCSSTPGNLTANSLSVHNSFLNGSTPTKHSSNSVNPTSHYPGYQCNGSISVDNYLSAVSSFNSNSQKIETFQHQNPETLSKLGMPQVQAFYPQHQYGSHQTYRVGYHHPYGEHDMQVNGYSNYSMKNSVHQMGRYSSFAPNSQVNAHFLECIPRSSSVHPSLDYTAGSKAGQYANYPNPYLVHEQNPAVFDRNPDSFHTQSRNELLFKGSNGFSKMLPSLAPEPGTPSNSSYRQVNGDVQNGTAPSAAVENHKEVDEDVWSDSEHNFLDPEIGGVAVAPSHGSILIECAKRELHATTPIKKPDRNHPTRISLVFYQHKSMNEAKHGLALWEAKVAEKAREKEEELEKHGSDNVPNKHNGRKVKREHSDLHEHSEPPYKRFVQMLAQQSMSLTTDSITTTAPYAFTRVTGPYNRYI